mmetsp:Transcript_146526/g.266414  ORF Transcript_146526/g.266414 Transcript_146526/m.266414 type:complete len:128 (-) Transcript_146526:468-851(-)
MGSVCVRLATVPLVAHASVIARVIRSAPVRIWVVTQAAARLAAKAAPACARRALAPISTIPLARTNVRKILWELASGLPAPPHMVLRIALTASACVWTISALKQEFAFPFRAPLRCRQLLLDLKTPV